MEKRFKEKLFRIKFPAEKSITPHVYLPPGVGARGLGRLIWLKYNVQKLEIIFTSRLNAAKNTNFMEKRVQIKVF